MSNPWLQNIFKNFPWCPKLFIVIYATNFTLMCKFFSYWVLFINLTFLSQIDSRNHLHKRNRDVQKTVYAIAIPKLNIKKKIKSTKFKRKHKNWEKKEGRNIFLCRSHAEHLKKYFLYSMCIKREYLLT